MTTKSYIDEKVAEGIERDSDGFIKAATIKWLRQALSETYSKGREDERKPISKEDVDWFFSDESRTQKLRDAMNEEMKCHPKDKPVVMTDRIFEVIKEALQSHE